MRSYYVLLFSVCSLLLFSCKNERINNQNTLVPFRTVNASIVGDLNLISNPGTARAILGNGNTLSTGVKGIVVYNVNNTSVNGSGRFLAYDMACPYIPHSDDTPPMRFDRDKLTLTYAQDDIVFGIPFVNKATVDGVDYYLREYRVFLQGGTLRITNF